MKFKKDDKIEIVDIGCGDATFKIGDVGIYLDIESVKMNVSGKSMYAAFRWYKWKLIKEATMDLRARIEAVTGWDRIADNLLQDIMGDKSFDLSYTQHSSDKGFFRPYYDDSGERFDFTTQCSKLQAFKKALLWLAEKSGKLEDKTKIKEEIKDIEYDMIKLKNRLEKLEEKL